MLTDTTAGVLAPQALARTYNTPGQLQPWDAGEQYERVIRAANRAPNKGSAALASKLELPRSRIRTWIDDGEPDVVRGLSIAHDHGWFDGDTVTAWAVLLAGIVGGGSITVSMFQPEWTTVPDQAADRIKRALDDLDVGHQCVERVSHPSYLRPGEDLSIIGRALAALDAPVGHKNADSDPLPDWLLTAPLQARVAAIEVFVFYRGTGFDNKDTVALSEDRSPAFRDSVARLIGSVVDNDVTVGEYSVTISASAARELGVGREGHLRAALENRD